MNSMSAVFLTFVASGTLAAQAPSPSWSMARAPALRWSAAFFTERESEALFQTGRGAGGYQYEREFSPLRRTGLEIGWWREGSTFRPSLEVASGQAPQGHHGHMSLHLEWGSPGPFLVQGGFLLINQTHGPTSKVGYGGRLQLGWLFRERIAVMAYAGLAFLFQDQTPQSNWADFPGAFSGIKVAVRF